MKQLFSCALLCALFLAGCSKSEPSPENGPLASITVKIVGDGGSGSRYVGPPSQSTATEKLVTNLTVFVFNYRTGNLERSKSFQITGSDYTAQIDSLSTGTEKRVVAYVNVPGDMPLVGIDTYGDLRANILTLESQNAANISTVGFFMSGETDAPVNLQQAGQNRVTVPVRRRVAKIILKSLIVRPEDGSAVDISKFKLDGVSIQKARITGTPLGYILAPGGTATDNYVGGIATPGGIEPAFNTTKPYLYESIPVANVTPGDSLVTYQTQRYFYVLPNDGEGGNQTLMTIEGAYGDAPEQAYYPFVINGTSSTEGGSTTDGNFIECNRIYTLDVTLKKIDLPSEDPNYVPSQAVMDIVIAPQDWELTLNQVEEW